MSANEGDHWNTTEPLGGNQLNFILTQTKSFDSTPTPPPPVINDKRSQTKRKKKTFDGLKKCVQEGYSC